MLVNMNQLCFIEATRTYVVEASSLQLPPGRIPAAIIALDQNNVEWDFRYQKPDTDGEGWWFNCAKMPGVPLLLIND